MAVFDFSLTWHYIIISRYTDEQGHAGCLNLLLDILNFKICSPFLPNPCFMAAVWLLDRFKKVSNSLP